MDGPDNDLQDPILDIPVHVSVLEGRAKLEEERLAAIAHASLQALDSDGINRSLADYRVIEEPDQAEPGSFLRWLRRSDGKLFNGGYFCRSEMRADGTFAFLCRNARGRLFQFSFNEFVVFQKLSDAECIVLALLSS